MTAQPFALVDADFADGNYTFGLTWPLAAEWEKTTDRSLYANLINIMRSGFAQLQDTRELIRLGLIGGGMAPTDALRMVRLYVEERPAAENFGLVVKIVDAFFHGKGVPGADDESAGSVDG